MGKRFVAAVSVLALSTPCTAFAETEPEPEPGFAEAAVAQQPETRDQDGGKNLDGRAVAEALIFGTVGGLAISCGGMWWVRRGLGNPRED